MLVPCLRRGWKRGIPATLEMPTVGREYFALAAVDPDCDFALEDASGRIDQGSADCRDCEAADLGICRAGQLPLFLSDQFPYKRFPS